MGNLFAYTALLGWPLLVLYFYKTKNIQMATLIAIVVGYMVLPVGLSVDFPLIPALDKDAISVIAALLGCWLIRGKRIVLFSGSGWAKYLIFAFLFSPVFTVMTNTESVISPALYLPGLTTYDSFSILVAQFLVIIPYILGRQLFRTGDDHLVMFRFLVLAGISYSLLMLFEIRMSPQLHSWLYGYFPHSFGQQYRFGGFRPVVFMGHGLWVAFFSVVVFISAAILWKNKLKMTRFKSNWLTYYFAVLLVLCKSVASFLYGFFAFILLKLTSSKTQMKVALIAAILAISYPALSILNIFPHQSVVETANLIGADRAQSLQFRFDNEETLLTHARERVIFGWGGWGRNRVYDEETGVDQTVTDGRWIITFGVFGLIGFLAEFGLLSISIFKARKAFRLLNSKKEQTLLAGHSLLVAIIMIDQLPNASLSPWLWLISGILLGRSESIISAASNERTQLRKLS